MALAPKLYPIRTPTHPIITTHEFNTMGIPLSNSLTPHLVAQWWDSGLLKPSAYKFV